MWFAGGILRIAGIAMTPRIILMTDGQPTDSAGEEKVITIYLRRAALFCTSTCAVHGGFRV